MKRGLYEYLKSTILGELERVTDRCHGVASVGVSRHVLVDTLHADLNARAAIGEHLVQVGLQAVVRASLDGDADALGSVLKIRKNMSQINSDKCLWMKL